MSAPARCHVNTRRPPHAQYRRSAQGSSTVAACAFRRHRRVRRVRRVRQLGACGNDRHMSFVCLLLDAFRRLSLRPLSRCCIVGTTSRSQNGLLLCRVLCLQRRRPAKGGLLRDGRLHVWAFGRLGIWPALLPSLFACVLVVPCPAAIAGFLRAYAKFKHPAEEAAPPCFIRPSAGDLLIRASAPPLQACCWTYTTSCWQQCTSSDATRCRSLIESSRMSPSFCLLSFVLSPPLVGRCASPRRTHCACL